VMYDTWLCSSGLPLTSQVIDHASADFHLFRRSLTVLQRTSTYFTGTSVTHHSCFKPLESRFWPMNLSDEKKRRR
jgi:hypothetical protein